MTTETFAEAMQHSEPSPERDRKALVMLLRQRESIEREQIEQTAWFNAIRAIYVEESDRREATLTSIDEAIEELAKELKPADSQHVDVPGIARIQFKTTPEYLRVADTAAFIAWAKDAERGDLITERVTESVDTAAAKELATEARKETGEMLPGIEVVPEVVKMTIQDRSAK